jgi:hypothetical protein
MSGASRSNSPCRAKKSSAVGFDDLAAFQQFGKDYPIKVRWSQEASRMHLVSGLPPEDIPGTFPLTNSNIEIFLADSAGPLGGDWSLMSSKSVNSLWHYAPPLRDGHR